MVPRNPWPDRLEVWRKEIMGLLSHCKFPVPAVLLLWPWQDKRSELPGRAPLRTCSLANGTRFHTRG
jgi:hypothetical protein